MGMRGGAEAEALCLNIPYGKSEPFLERVKLSSLWQSPLSQKEAERLLSELIE